jgi:replicative DNA helicase
MTINPETVLPPHDIAAEEALLASILVDEAQYDEVSLVPTDFYHEPHRFIWQAFETLAGSQTTINQITVADTLNRMGKLEFCGGVAYLLYLVSICASPLDAFFYAEIIKRDAIARQIIEAGKAIQQIGFSNPVDTTKALTECDEKITNVRKSGIPTPIVSPKVRASAQFDRYTEMQESQKTIAISTGIAALDRQLGGGFYPGELTIVAARAGLGKTTLLSHCANVACQKGIQVLFCSAEMDVDSITDREVAQYVGVPVNRIRRGNYSKKLYAQIQEAIGAINDKPVWMYTETPMTTGKILQHALAMKLRHGLGMLMIDYLGILDDQYGRNPYERITHVSRQLKQMARMLAVPVIVAAQLNRESATREDKRPQLSDLRDSGAIEQDADVVLMLYRDSYYDPSAENDNTVEIIVAKQRQGESNRIVKARFNKMTQTYLNYTQDDIAEQEEML